jgi:1,4-alpha-glucan branching enzyme
MITKTPSRDPNKVVVRFELPSAIWAESVHLVGDFNNWNRGSHPLMRDRDTGTWHIVLELERGTQFQFRYLVNGEEWHNDWRADDYVANPFGGTNSVVSTMPPPEGQPPLDPESRR